MLKAISTVLILNCFLVQVVNASVALRNGNEFDSFSDGKFTGGMGIERAFNSKSSFFGRFGWGWGNEYETYLEIAADGSLVIHEYGSGADNRFTPSSLNAQTVAVAVQKIVDVAVHAGIAGSASGLASYKQKLMTDPAYRNSEWQKFIDQKKLQPQKVAMGVAYTSDRFNHQKILRTKDGYIRTFVDGGKTETFSDQGRLVRMDDKNGNFIKLIYGNDGHLQTLIDNFSRKIFWSYNSQGLVSKIETENKKIATYSYNAQKELIMSQDMDGNAYTYKYDSQGRHNLTQIGYSDHTTKDITYYGRDQNEHVKSVKDRDGTLTEYQYKEKGNILDIVTKMKAADGKLMDTTEYEYEFGHSADGVEWTKRLKITNNGDVTETHYNEKFGLPVRIQQGKDLTLFEYDDLGHVLKKVTPSETTELRYDLNVGKVNYASHMVKGEPQKTWSEFKYDPRGNLIFAKNSVGKVAKIAYDRVGRILAMVDEGKHQIQFKYNENSKPIEISDPQIGKISVSYTNSGEIKKVDSTNRKIAAQVQQEFEQLLEIIRPAGVTLTPEK